MKYLASAWIRHKSEEYVNFLEGQTIDEYCTNYIESVNVEIDNVALQALYEVLIEPASFDLEVFYLDLSPGDSVTVHKHNNTAVPENQVIRVLYKPSVCWFCLQGQY